MIQKNATYVHICDGLFKTALPFEQLHNKDLYSFTVEDLYTMFKNIAPMIKYTTALSYNSLIKKYKEWCVKNGMDATVDVCNVKDINKFSANFKQYVIFNDEDIDDITINLPADGADYNVMLFIRIFWEIDGQEEVNDILKLRIQDIFEEHNILRINNHYYNVSTWLIESLLEFSQMERLTFKNKLGTYRILTAEENGGYIFRTTYTARGKFGEPMDAIKFSNLIYQFSERNLDEIITINDLMMSLSLRYMVINKMTNTEMHTSKRYFKNMPSYVFAEIFNAYAKEKYVEPYKKYVDYFRDKTGEDILTKKQRVL